MNFNERPERVKTPSSAETSESEALYTKLEQLSLTRSDDVEGAHSAADIDSDRVSEPLPGATDPPRAQSPSGDTSKGKRGASANYTEVVTALVRVPSLSLPLPLSLPPSLCLSLLQCICGVCAALELSAYVADCWCVQVMHVQNSHVGRIIGRGGVRIREIEEVFVFFGCDALPRALRVSRVIAWALGLTRSRSLALFPHRALARCQLTGANVQLSKPNRSDMPLAPTFIRTVKVSGSASQVSACHSALACLV